MENNKKFRSRGIEIHKDQGSCYVELDDILDKILCGSDYYWSIQNFDVQGYTGKPGVLKKIEKEVSENGNHLILWDELRALAKEVTQFIWLVLVGSSNKSDLKSYPIDLERYENTDYSIEAFDG